MALYELAILTPAIRFLTQCGGKECSCCPLYDTLGVTLGWVVLVAATPPILVSGHLKALPPLILSFLGCYSSLCLALGLLGFGTL